MEKPHVEDIIRYEMTLLLALLLGMPCTSAADAFRAGQIERAAQLARACIDAGEGNAETFKLLALSSFLLNRLDDYRVNMERVVALNPRDATAHYHLGRFFYESKRFTEALERFSTALGIDPQNYRAHYFSGLCRQSSGDSKGAAESFRSAIEIIERDKAAYGWPFADLGDLLISQGDFDGGLAWIYRATRNDPGQPYTHYVYARALLRGEPTREIEGELQRAIKLDPGYTEAYYALGRYYSRVGEADRARAAFAKFGELRKNPAPSPFGLRR
jgi:tetratricopeptide (TPR) repeat protein